MRPAFLYFDLGKVLVDFDMNLMCRQMGEVAGIDPARVWKVVFDGQLQWHYETGRISSTEFYETFCRATDTRPEYEALARAGSDIFELNVSLLPVVAQLQWAGYRMGILSNTCETHWQHCRRRYRMIAEAFPVQTLSYRVGAAKPDAAIFRAAAELAGVDPPEILFIDDTAGHVAGALAVGFDAVQYVSTPQLVSALRQREVRLNY